MALKLPSIPRTTRDIPKSIVDVLNPMRNIIEARFLGRNSVETVVTRADLVKLGLVTSQQLQQLEDRS